MGELTQFVPLVAELGRDIDVIQGSPTLPAEKAAQWSARLRAAPEQAKQEIATHLVGLALKVRKLAGSQADALMLQLAELLAVLVGSAQAAVSAFDQAGVNLKKAASSIGIDTATRTADKGEKPAGATSVMDFLLRGKKM